MSRSNEQRVRCPVADSLVCEICPEAEREWELDRLLKDLGVAKGFVEMEVYEFIHEVPDEELDNPDFEIPLTEREKCWLRLLLQGYDVQEVERHLRKKEKTLTSDFSKTIYKYVSFLVGKRVKDWSHVRLFLDCKVEPTYRINLSVSQEKLDMSITISPEDLSRFKETLSRELGREIDDEEVNQIILERLNVILNEEE